MPRLLPLVNLDPPYGGAQRTTPATHGNRALSERQKGPFLGLRRAASVPTTVLSEIATRMYLRAVLVSLTLARGDLRSPGPINPVK